MGITIFSKPESTSSVLEWQKYYFKTQTAVALIRYVAVTTFCVAVYKGMQNIIIDLFQEHKNDIVSIVTTFLTTIAAQQNQNNNPSQQQGINLIRTICNTFLRAQNETTTYGQSTYYQLLSLAALRPSHLVSDIFRIYRSDLVTSIVGSGVMWLLSDHTSNLLTRYLSEEFRTKLLPTISSSDSVFLGWQNLVELDIFLNWYWFPNFFVRYVIRPTSAHYYPSSKLFTEDPRKLIDALSSTKWRLSDFLLLHGVIRLNTLISRKITSLLLFHLVPTKHKIQVPNEPNKWKSQTFFDNAKTVSRSILSDSSKVMKQIISLSCFSYVIYYSIGKRRNWSPLFITAIATWCNIAVATRLGL